ncbi:rhomboid family intramembrane serine protease [Aquibacillus sediminis]|uniref:rhomboid family intramembrane serine protease n=1 Tax=Aquibacillus sediminis TaxID=2574734 RepID=UPI001108E41A|nr:rhomboid family intramembrane serine protease [Aquibacillus sediminis]
MFIRTENFRDFTRFYPVVTTIIAIQLSIWLLVFLFPAIGGPLFQWGVGVNFWISQGEYWRLVTPIFIHDPNGVMHVLFNSFSLVLFGPALEQMLGKTKFIFAYLFTGVFANLLTYFTESTMYSHVGASGAIFGIFGIYIFMVVFRKHLIDQANAQVISTIVIIGLVMTFLRSGVNIFGHLFGFIGGVALGPIILRNVQPFSIWRNRRAPRNDDSIQFDPNRWNKKRFSIKKYARPAIWTIIILLVVLGLIARLF